MLQIYQWLSYYRQVRTLCLTYIDLWDRQWPHIDQSIVIWAHCRGQLGQVELSNLFDHLAFVLGKFAQWEVTEI